MCRNALRFNSLGFISHLVSAEQVGRSFAERLRTMTKMQSRDSLTVHLQNRNKPGRFDEGPPDLG
jgi:hypothetical protein